MSQGRHKGDPGIARILREGRRAVAFTYTLTLVENACALAYPALTGLAVDGLVKRDFRYLGMLVAVWLLHLVISFGRQRYDTRVFMGLNAKIASHMVAQQHELGHGTSTVSARVEMVRDIVGFFETEVPDMFRHAVTIVGSLAMLFTYDTDAGLIALVVLLPMGLVNAWYWRKALRLNQGINNQMEREVDDIESLRPFRVRRHFWLMRRWRVMLSDAESWTWALTELCTIAALVFILIDFTQSPAFTAGAIYAVLAYVYDYLESLNHVPTLVNNLARLKDVRTRL
ncbi:ABC transporter six-transmembrane domain-containing protein [Variovorax sp. OV329]|uniref:ABC transporter six-transmembrane domain-containing protein n=1 Tax=Variovorax sp. OV329 TaxID=1882825 RepID=UPI0008EB6A8F|nr:ABC transporter six-transmembrane domain-containing protein [Variovorax sp. OV329]SFN49122.1 ABC transporter transmembrane region [Variovorax sp. OV329]